MADLYQRPYLEASGFIALIRGEVRNGVDRARIISHILHQAEIGMYRIYTSAFTLAEVHKRRGGTVEGRNDEFIELAHSAASRLHRGAVLEN